MEDIPIVDEKNIVIKSTPEIKKIVRRKKQIKKRKHENCDFRKLMELEMKNLNCRCNTCSFNRSYFRVKLLVLLKRLRKFKDTGHYKKTFAFTSEI